MWGSSIYISSSISQIQIKYRFSNKIMLILSVEIPNSSRMVWLVTEIQNLVIIPYFPENYESQFYQLRSYVLGNVMSDTSAKIIKYIKIHLNIFK